MSQNLHNPDPPESDPRQPLREILARRGLQPDTVRTALETGKIFLRDAPTSMAGRLVHDEDVSIRMDAPRTVVGRDLAIVYHDADLAVVSKPPGMLAVPAPGRRGESSVLSVVQRRLGRALPVHRLDEQTSGLMIVALNETARAALIDEVSAHRIERIYLAIASGSPRFDERTVDTLIAPDRGDGLRGSVRHDDPDAVRAVTHLHVLERYARAALIEARLQTGRTHQIRIHLAELRLPLLGDPIYAPHAIRQLAPRLALHSARLAFTHPLSNKRLQFVTELPDDLERVRIRLAAEPSPSAEAPAREARRTTAPPTKPQRPKRART